ncbi:MAG: trigger factor [Gaiellaceae bacterium]
METQVEQLADNRVRLSIEVSSHDVRHAVDHAAADLAASARIPGFRKGKVPLPVLVARVGRDRLYTEAVESHIGGWFRNAAATTKIRPVEQPEYGYDLPDSPDESFSFTATVAVQPPPEVADWTQLEVPAAEPEVPEELVERELEGVRRTVAELTPVEGRPAQDGDTLVIDVVAPSGEAQRDVVLELGSGKLVEEIETTLAGMSAGETRAVRYELADGSERNVEVTVKEIKEAVLPPVDDELARAATEFDTLAELRTDIEARLREQLSDELEVRFRETAIDRLVDASRVEIADRLVDVRASELWHGLAHSLERRGIQPELYFQLTGQTPEQLTEQLRAESRQAIGRELVLEAVAEQLGLEVADEQVEALVRDQAADSDDDPDEIIRQLRAGGRWEALRADIRLRDALDRIVAEVKRIPVDLARARDRLWTPEQETPETATKLWTPRSKEPA